MISGDRITWIKQNQHICLNPYTVIHDQVSKDKLQTTCCCNLLPSEHNDRNFSDLKVSIENGVKNSRCQVCYKSEEQIGSSERTMGLMSRPIDVLNKFITTKAVDEFEFRIKFSNLCNLACKTCQPEFSSKYAQVYNIKVSKNIQKDISNDDVFWNTLTSEIQQKCNEVPYVVVALLGGESLIQQGALRLIDWLIDNNLSQHIILRLTTNFTNLKDNIIKNFSKFKSVSICASIDSVGENYSYVRYPATFDTIQSNLSLALSDSITFSVTPVWSLHNIFYVTEYLDWWHNWFTENNRDNIPVNNVSMSEPFLMTIQNLPVDYRSNLLNIIQQAITHPIFTNPIHNQFYDYLIGVANFLSGTEIVYNKFGAFLEQTARDDVATGKHMSTGNSKLYNILTALDKQQYLDYINQYS